MLKLILLSVGILLTASQTITSLQGFSVGGFQNYSDLSSKEFQKILDYIYANRPKLTGYRPTAVQRQLVNGFNYRVSLQNDAGCRAQVVVYSTFADDLVISSSTNPLCPNGVTVPPPITLSGAYTVQSNPSGQNFENALAQALTKNRAKRSDLVLVETQVVSGTNYRFTFRNNDGSLTQTVIYAPLRGIPVPAIESLSDASAQTLSIIPNAGGWTVLSNQNSYSNVLDEIFKAYPQVKGYSVSGVDSQVVAGMNYRVGLWNNSANEIEYALFEVYVNLKGTAKITLLEQISVESYTVKELIKNYNDSLKLHSQLAGSTLIRISNIWQKEGLSFTFQKDEKKHRVFIYSNNGQLRNLIF